MVRLKFSRTLIAGLVGLVLFFSYDATAGDPKGRVKRGTLRKTATLESAHFDGNRINNIMINNGQFVSHVVTGNSGMEWPKGTFELIDFASGIWIAGKKDTNHYTAAAEYAVEFAPGVILPGGAPDDPTLSKYKWYKISRADLSNPGADYVNWPAADGAPVNPDGTPALAGDQMLWTVFNDANSANHANVFGTSAMGVEVQMTVWGYNRPDAFGDMMFVKAKVIHKGTITFDSTFMSIWDDPDLGDAGDDYVGCDTTLSLGYCWNADNNDAGHYGAAPPAIGRDFFQGPIVPSPGDTANVSGRKVPGFKNLPMYSFAYYINGAPFPRQDPASALEVFRYMTGKFQDGTPFINPISNQATRFIFPGDPQSGTGWTELNPTILQPGDRRLLMSSGPFTFAPGDTQEVVFGVLIARGGDNKNSVTVLKQVDAVAQLAYDLNFALPPSPPKINVTSTGLDQEVVLYWDNKAESYNVVDLIDRDTSGATSRYMFEGYIVYQVNAPSAPSIVKRLAVYDLAGNNIKEIKDLAFDPVRGEQILVTSVKGTDGGIERELRTRTDAVLGLPFSNSRPYYFAVTAYGYNEWGIPKMYEGPLDIITVVPQSVAPGTRYASAYGDTLKNVTHTGPADASIVVIVKDPGKVTGSNYRVDFRVDTATGGTVWDLVDVTKNQVRLAGQTNQTGDGAFTIVDGLLVKVLGPPFDLKDLQHVANPSGPIDPPTYVGWGLAFNGWDFPDPSGQTNPAADWGGGRWGIHTGGSGGGDESYVGRFVPRVFRGDNFSRFVPSDYEIRFVDTTTIKPKGYLAFTTGSIVTVPFEIWNIGVNTPGNASDDFRMIPLINDADGNERFNLLQTDHGLSGGDNDPYTDWIYFYEPANKATGSVGYNAWAASELDADIGDEVMARVVLVNLNGGSVSDPTWPANATSVMPATGNVIRILSTKPNTSADNFTFSTANFAGSYSQDVAAADLGLIRAVPNPYLGSNSLERNPQNRFLTFTRLPDQAKTTIRIFTLAGVHIRQIEHTSATTYERWDLRNASGIPVASGMYFVHIEVEGVGSTILKVAVIQPEERLDRL